jgi:hypothetical protein
MQMQHEVHIWEEKEEVKYLIMINNINIFQSVGKRMTKLIKVVILFKDLFFLGGS